MVKNTAMETIIAMQDIRQSLASIARRAERGERFVVVRNSRPVFRIEPATRSYCSEEPRAHLAAREVRERFAAEPVREDELSPADLDSIIREVRRAPRP